MGHTDLSLGMRWTSWVSISLTIYIYIYIYIYICNYVVYVGQLTWQSTIVQLGVPHGGGRGCVLAGLVPLLE